MYFLLLPDHWQDVVAGSVLGIVTAYFSYRQYFPSLASKLAHLPYSPRIHHPDGTHGSPPDTLPYYHEPLDDGTEVELLHETVRRDGTGQPEQIWGRGPSEESRRPSG